MNDLTLEKEARIQRKLELFAVDDPSCVWCGENHPICLRSPKLSADDDQIYCWNCWEIKLESELSPTAIAKRRATKLKNMGSKLAICLTCGMTESCTLELHHWLQEDFSAETQVNCMNCHKLFSEAQYHHPPFCKTPSGFISHVAKIFSSLADEYELRALRRRKIISELSRLLPANTQSQPEKEASL